MSLRRPDAPAVVRFREENAERVDFHCWVQFELEGRDSNRSAIGAMVEVRAGGVHSLRVVDGGSGFCSQNGRRVHVGLGGEDRIESVTIHWPSGRRQVLEDVAVDVVHHIVESAP